MFCIPTRAKFFSLKRVKRRKKAPEGSRMLWWQCRPRGWRRWRWSWTFRKELASIPDHTEWLQKLLREKKIIESNWCDILINTQAQKISSLSITVIQYYEYWKKWMTFAPKWGRHNAKKFRWTRDQNLLCIIFQQKIESTIEVYWNVRLL